MVRNKSKSKSVCDILIQCHNVRENSRCVKGQFCMVFVLTICFLHAIIIQKS